MPNARLFFVRCNGDGSWLTKRTTEGGGQVFDTHPPDPMLVSGPVMANWKGAYELIPTPWTVETWPMLPDPEKLRDAIAEGHKALGGDSNDAEHDALLSLMAALGEEEA